jgi:hypothetical protein
MFIIDVENYFLSIQHIRFKSIIISFTFFKLKVTVKLAVTQKALVYYLCSRSSAGIISGDSSNVVELVRQQYQAITTTIKAENNATANSNVKITTK